VPSFEELNPGFTLTDGLAEREDLEKAKPVVPEPEVAEPEPESEK